MKFNELSSLYGKKNNFTNYFESKTPKIVLLREKVLNYVEFVCNDIINLISEEEFDKIIKERYLTVRVNKNEHMMWYLINNIRCVYEGECYENSKYMELVSFIQNNYFPKECFPHYSIAVSLELDLALGNIALNIHVGAPRRENVSFYSLSEDLSFIFKGAKTLLSSELFKKTLHLEYINLQNI